MFAGF
ncbi:hypothetical protein ECEC1870_1543, partial [Escherichia coli EC1870]